MRWLTIFYDFACSPVALPDLKDFLGRSLHPVLPLRSPIPVLEPDGGPSRSSAAWRRLCGASNCVGRSLRILMACARNRERSASTQGSANRKHAAGLSVFCAAQTSATGAIGLNFNFEANLHDLTRRHSEIRRWKVCVEVHRCEQGFSPDRHA
jgi:hypothetical protein